MKTVVFVDDELSILEGLRRNLRRMRSEWDMHFFSEPRDALAFVQDTPVDAIVSDMRMPGMNGAELLQAVQASRPDTIRIALSGYADSELILESVHTIHRYISKPAELETIRDAVARSLALREQLSSPQISAYVGALGALPSLPDIYNQITALVGDDNFSLADVAHLIEQDIGLSSVVLKIVNSAFFGNFGNIDSVAQAVTMLGSDTIKNIVLTEELVKQFDKATTEEFERLNALSKSVSALAQRFARSAALDKRAIDHSQLGGMVSVLGDMIVLDQGEPEGLSEKVEPPVIVGYLLSLWSMPDPLVEAVVGHREPVDTASEPRTDGVSPTDCVRAAWLAYGEYVSLPEDERPSADAPLRDALAHLAQSGDLGEKWFGDVIAVM